MSRNIELVQLDEQFKVEVISQLTQLVDAVSQGFVYLLILMSIFYLLRQGFHYKMDKTSANMLDEKLEKTISVLDEKLQQY